MTARQYTVDRVPWDNIRRVDTDDIQVRTSVMYAYDDDDAPEAAILQLTIRDMAGGQSPTIAVSDTFIFGVDYNEKLEALRLLEKAETELFVRSQGVRELIDYLEARYATCQPDETKVDAHLYIEGKLGELPEG